MKSPPTVLVATATYNERENILALLQQVRAACSDADILVVDDSSPDGTAELVAEHASTVQGLHLVSRPGKQGLGTAYLLAMTFAESNGYDILVTLDADLSHPPEVIPFMLQEMQSADVVIGSRYVAGGGIDGWGLKRKLMSRLINMYARLVLGLREHDTSGGFRAYRVTLLEQIDRSRVVSNGYAFLEEFLFRCKQSGGVIVEVPIVFTDRVAGQSKINFLECIKAVSSLLFVGVSERAIRGVSGTRKNH